jgi:hypothetical protein
VPARYACLCFTGMSCPSFSNGQIRQIVLTSFFVSWPFYAFDESPILSNHVETALTTLMEITEDVSQLANDKTPHVIPYAQS